MESSTLNKLAITIPFRKDIDSRWVFNIICHVPVESKVKFKDTMVDNIYNEQ